MSVHHISYYQDHNISTRVAKAVSIEQWFRDHSRQVGEVLGSLTKLVDNDTRRDDMLD